MTKLRTLALLVVLAHWVVAIWHLFVAAKVLPGAGHNVSGLAVVLITLGHACVCIALWKLRDRFSGLVLLVFFLAAMTADLYEHFLHASANNVFMLAAGAWTAWFDVSVLALVALEITACSLAVLLLRGGWRPRPVL